MILIKLEKIVGFKRKDQVKTKGMQNTPSILSVLLNVRSAVPGKRQTNLELNKYSSSNINTDLYLGKGGGALKNKCFFTALSLA